MLHIDKIEVLGSKGISTIEFAQNLTLIIGKSETGKTTIYKCIDYLFGAKNDIEHRPFLTSTGYDTIIGYFSTHLGKLKITRVIDSPNLKVETNIPTIDTSKKYSEKSSSSAWIGIVFNEILGVPKEFKIPWSSDGKMKLFSWRTLKKALMIHEKKADTEESIILPKEQTDRTAFLSNLLYMLYQTDFTDYDAEDGANIKKIRKAAVQRYIASKKDLISKKLEELKKQLGNINKEDMDLENILKEIKENLERINTSIKSAIKDDQKISKTIIDIQQKIIEKNLTLKRFQTLETQYTADIKRLSLIVDSEKVVASIPKNNKCPFCNSDVQITKQESYLQASRGELAKTLQNANELNEARQDIENDLTKIKADLSAANQRKDEIQQLLNKDLLPMQTTLKTQLNMYKQIIEYRKALSVYSEMDTTYNIDFKEYDKVDTKINYKPKTLFAKNFSEKIATYFKELLKETCFKPIETVKFDMGLFDIIVNDNPKPNRSKGYAAYFNSLLVLSLRCYINEVSVLNPHFYFLDSPLHGLMTETDDENNEEDLRKGFFKYLFNNYGEDQIIIIENTEKKELPNIEYNPEHIKIYTFTKDKENGRYGFLDGVFQN